MPSGSKPQPGPLSRSVGAILRGRMARIDVGTAEIAASVGVSRSQLSKMLRGVAHIDIEQLASFATSVGLDPVAVLVEAWQGVPPQSVSTSITQRGSVSSAGVSPTELGRRMHALIDLHALDDEGAYRLASAAAARGGTWLSHMDWEAVLNGSGSLEAPVLAVIATAFEAPAEYLLVEDKELANRIEAEAVLARAAADAGVSRVAARGPLSPEAMREIAALMTRRIPK